MLARFTQEWLDGSERRTRDELRALPAGTYSGSFTIEGDGFEPGKRFEVHAAVTVGDGTIDIDFAGTSPQSGGAINASYSQAVSGVIYAVRCLVDPTIPMNEGCFRAVRMHLPPGTLLNPNPPAACGGRVISVTAAIEAVLAALARRASRPSGRAERAHPRLLAHGDRQRRAPLGEPLLRLRRDRRAPRCRRARRNRLLLPRGSIGDPADRAARGAVPVRRPTVAPVARLRRYRPMAGRARYRDRRGAARGRRAHRYAATASSSRPRASTEVVRARPASTRSSAPTAPPRCWRRSRLAFGSKPATAS